MNLLAVVLIYIILNIFLSYEAGRSKPGTIVAIWLIPFFNLYFSFIYSKQHIWLSTLLTISMIVWINIS